MAAGDKPYRLYRGGRVKGKVPVAPRTRPVARPADERGARPPRRRRILLWTGLALGALVLLALVWGVLGYRSFADGVERATEAGIGAIIQPGGSRRDEAVVAAAEKARIPMVITRMRQFRH